MGLFDGAGYESGAWGGGRRGLKVEWEIDFACLVRSITQSSYTFFCNMHISLLFVSAEATVMCRYKREYPRKIMNTDHALSSSLHLIIHSGLISVCNYLLVSLLICLM